MAYTTIKLKNPHNGFLKDAPVGYSWTGLFFGFLLPAFRGDWKWSLITLVLSIVTGGVFNIIVFPFIYNKIYLKNAFNKGYKVLKIDEKYREKLTNTLGSTAISN